MKKFLVLLIIVFICAVFSISSNAATNSNATNLNSASQLQAIDTKAKEIKKVNDEIVVLNYIGMTIQ